MTRNVCFFLLVCSFAIAAAEDVQYIEAAFDYAKRTWATIPCAASTGAFCG